MKREGDRVRNQCQSYIMVVKVVFLAPGVAFNRTAIILGDVRRAQHERSLVGCLTISVGEPSEMRSARPQRCTAVVGSRGTVRIVGVGYN